MELGLLGAFVGGVLTLLSPCSVMLLPAFFSYAFTAPGALLARTGVFYLGLITTLVPLGVLAGTLGAFVNEYRDAFVGVAAVVVIVLGVLMLLDVPLPMLSRTQRSAGTSTASVYALGTIYGLAGVCAGPLLGAVLTFAAVSGNALRGGVVLLVFAAGMALPLLVLSLLWDRLPFVRGLVRPRQVRIGRWENTWTGVVGGALTAAVGVLMLVTRGTTSVGGVLGASDQARLEGRVLELSGAVPDWAVVLVVLVVAGSAWFVLHRRNRAG
ncbi:MULTISPECIES: cytochrome c biogenesis CcdA family protein [unclassified Saccharopolyspora]|uniref:cytochrome c biogenesis CcdA family protein n=1 Tax=unclassified Saccharopolyspora TaxID=2646250 RepID=UPI001CD23584|nr:MULTISPECIES: cytochrome c biogenesis CcdA family protein [unclassified Saccharopolyspora]MCA1184953.1 cytochrome c biogenesis CcdA family protein [Saccharopolyspora sp. 6T]MCA1279881.1 cytochrome c biogenesis CcdA family protein [Saccharopolyspora sp. 7B]